MVVVMVANKKGPVGNQKSLTDQARSTVFVFQRFYCSTIQHSKHNAVIRYGSHTFVS